MKKDKPPSRRLFRYYMEVYLVSEMKPIENNEASRETEEQKGDSLWSEDQYSKELTPSSHVLRKG